MFKLARKWWKYLTAKLTGSFNERADPKVQLEQAITEAKTQHVRLKEQAANVIANQKQGEIRLNGKMTELEKLNANARQALIMAADAEKAGDAAKAAQYNSAAETIANQLIQIEKDVESLKTMVLESAQASDQAKAAVQQNSRLLQEKIAEKSKLLSQLDQAKMQEQMNSAMTQLNESIGADVPTFKEVEEKIQARYTRAKATSELNETSVESRVLEVEQATANVEAQGRLSQLRSELGLDSGAAPAVGHTQPGHRAGRRPRGPIASREMVRRRHQIDVGQDAEPRALGGGEFRRAHEDERGEVGHAAGEAAGQQPGERVDADVAADVVGGQPHRLAGECPGDHHPPDRLEHAAERESRHLVRQHEQRPDGAHEVRDAERGAESEHAPLADEQQGEDHVEHALADVDDERRARVAGGRRTREARTGTPRTRRGRERTGQRSRRDERVGRVELAALQQQPDQRPAQHEQRHPGRERQQGDHADARAMLAR